MKLSRIAAPILRLSTLDTVPKGFWAALPKNNVATLPSVTFNLIDTTS